MVSLAVADPHRPFRCTRSPVSILYVAKFREWGIPIPDGGTSFLELSFCPFCGAHLPPSLRDAWFDRAESLRSCGTAIRLLGSIHRPTIANMRHALCLSLFLITLVSPQTEAAEKHASQIVIQVLKSKRAIEQSPICSNGCVFLSAWDFDGTILKGDASEGLIENSKTIYPGLSQKSIEAGYSNIYTKHDFQKFWKEYEEMDKIQGHIPAYTYLAKILKGSHSEEVKKFAANYYAHVLMPYYFRSSVEVFQQLRQNGITPYIISAAPHVFVSSAGPTLSIDENHIFGIEVALSPDGTLTDRVVEPIPYAEGKAKRLAMIVHQEQARSKKPVYVLAAFGNSYHTDSNFLQWTLSQKFPAGKPVVVMINGGIAPREHSGKFTEVTQTTVLGN